MLEPEISIVEKYDSINVSRMPNKTLPGVTTSLRRRYRRHAEKSVIRIINSNISDASRTREEEINFVRKPLPTCVHVCNPLQGEWRFLIQFRDIKVLLSSFSPLSALSSSLAVLRSFHRSSARSELKINRRVGK